MGRGILRAFSLLAALLVAASGHALDHHGLRRSVEAFMQGQIGSLQTRHGRDARIEFALVSMDPRLNLPDCPQPLALSIKEQAVSSRINVQVACNAGMGWSVYVPVDLAIYRPVVSAAGPLPRNTTLTDDNIQLVETDVTRLGGQYLTSAREAVGLSLKRQVNAGMPITGEMLAQPVLVKRGDAVTISVDSGGLNVRMPGVAMTDGRRGEQIRVKNTNSSKIVDAKVIDEGQVAVSM